MHFFAFIQQVFCRFEMYIFFIECAGGVLDLSTFANAEAGEKGFLVVQLACLAVKDLNYSSTMNLANKGVVLFCETSAI